MFARWIWRDDRFGAAKGKPIAQTARVIGAVGEQPMARAPDSEKGSGTFEIVGISRRNREGDGPPAIIGQRVDFRRPTAARGANGMMTSPPFAPAAERCALMCVESTAPVNTSLDPVMA